MARRKATDLDGIVELAASDPVAAIVRLVAAWRKSHDAGVGTAIEMLAPRTIQPIDGLPSKQKERAAALVRAVEAATDGTLSSVLVEVEPFVRSAAGALAAPIAREAKAIQLRCYRSVELPLAGLLVAVPHRPASASRTRPSSWRCASTSRGARGAGRSRRRSAR